MTFIVYMHIILNSQLTPISYIFNYCYYYYYYKCQDLSDAITTVARALYKVYQ